MKNSTRLEIFTWLIAGMCIFLGIVVAPLNGGMTVLPVIIGLALGYMAHCMKRDRLAATRGTEEA